MLPYRVYLPQELEAMSSLTPPTTAEPRRSPKGADGADAGPTPGRGLRALPAAVARLFGRGRVRRPAPGTI